MIINKNQNAPVFQKTAYSKTIPENYPFGQSIITVRATDGDTVNPYNVVRYEMVINNDYFYINPITGTLSLSKALTEDATKAQNYIVSKSKFHVTLCCTYSNL